MRLSLNRVYAGVPEGQSYYQTDGSGEPVLLRRKASLAAEEFTGMLSLPGCC
jgi:hypothetical protein